MPVIAIDAGHGYNTAGKRTPTDIREWTLNDDVRDRVVDILRDYDVQIVHTDNDEGEVDESLSSRVDRYVAAGAEVFVSIHHNAYTGTWNDATGVSVFTDKSPTVADMKLAKLIQTRLVKYTGLRDRGVQHENFKVINQNRIPAVLCEGGFMDGRKDYHLITSDVGKDAYARAVAEGLIEFLNLKKITKEEEDMNLESFTKLFNEYRNTLQDNDSSKYSEEARAWALKTGLVVGNGTTDNGQPNGMWEDLLTREQLVTVLYRFGKMVGLV